MMSGFMKIVLGVLLGLSVAPGAEGRTQDVQDAVVKVYTVHSVPDYSMPWAPRRNYSSTGSGAVIKGNRILTNAHVVHDGTMIQVRRHGGSRRFEAEILFVSHTADLAILTVDDPSFFEGIVPLELGPLPEKKSSVSVYGFPVGGDVLSVTEGIVSRVEHQTYTHSGEILLAIQIDAAINPGNSGGPAVDNGKIVGIAVQGIEGAQSMGYIIAPSVIKQFLTDIEDGIYQGIPGMGITYQWMENAGMRAFYGMTDQQSGILITGIGSGGSSEGHLQKDDVILSVDGHPIANDATVEFRSGERSAWNYYLNSHQLGDSITFEILRDKKSRTIQIPLTQLSASVRLIPDTRYDVSPTYYIYGGLVFVPCNSDLIGSLGENWIWAIPFVSERNLVSPDLKEMVVMQQVLASGVNEGYHDEFFRRIESVNGTKIRSLRHMIELIEAGEGDDHIVFESSDGGKIILDRKAVKKSGPKILKAYQVPKDRSEDLFKPVGE
jgi:S1-C subfamily serine protease